VSESRKLAAILVADVVGYSRLAGADEEGTLARLRATSCQSSRIAILIIVISYMPASGLAFPDAGRTLRRALGESD
jgi:hypothetical protein